VTAWTYFDIDGEPLPSSDNAAFKGRTIRVDAAVSAASVFDAPTDSAYHDVHAIDAPGLRKNFKSFALMRAWCREQAAKRRTGAWASGS
jgi:hypothetical protein